MKMKNCSNSVVDIKVALISTFLLCITIAVMAGELGSVGAVHFIEADEDLEYVLENGPHYPYVAVLTVGYFKLSTLEQFKSHSDRISGVILLYKDVDAVDSYSADKSCPNSYFDLYARNDSYSHCVRQKWNLIGDRDNERIDRSLMFNDWPFPMFLIRNETNITELRNCFDYHGKGWPLCAVELTASNYAAKDAKTCIRRSTMSNSPFNWLRKINYCRPLSSKNIFVTLFDTNKNTSIKDKSVVVLAARLDSFSMFSNLSPGVDSVITSLITFLAIAHTLSQASVRDELRAKAPDKNILFALFGAEAFDYIGSSRAVFDMNLGKFPVNPEASKSLEIAQIRIRHFSHFIELNQLGTRQDDHNQTLYVHKNIGSTDRIDEMIKRLQQNVLDTPNLTFESTADGQPLPPASLQTFLKEDTSLDGVVIANHPKEFKNKFYNSFLDTFERLNTSEANLVKSLTEISTVISRALLDLVANSAAPSAPSAWSNVTTDQTIVNQLFRCYVVNTNCSFFNSLTFKNPNKTLETYVGYTKSSLLSDFTSKTLIYLTGKHIPSNTSKECYDSDRNKSYTYDWMPGPSQTGICIQSQVVHNDRTSPAFEDYVDNGISNETLYSTWTHSKDYEISLRLFVSQNPVHQWLTLALGLVILVVAIVIISLMQTYSHSIFYLRRETSTSDKGFGSEQVDSI